MATLRNINRAQNMIQNSPTVGQLCTKVAEMMEQFDNMTDRILEVLKVCKVDIEDQARGRTTPEEIVSILIGCKPSYAKQALEKMGSVLDLKEDKEE